jgi:hypothetical protein
MKGLRIEFGGKALDAVRIDADAPRPEGLSCLNIFQVSLGHLGYLLDAPASDGQR